MSGHSKWSNIKYRKERQDAKKGLAFSKVSKMITVVARAKGGDPDKNPDLALAIDKAKQVNMPKENIERAIKKGTGELEGTRIEQETLEAFGPGGIGLIIKIITDNKNRTLAEIRSILRQHQGKLAENGAVKWKFDRKGQLIIRDQKGFNRDKLLELIIEVGASDYQELDNGLVVFTEPDRLHQIKEKLEKGGLKIESASFSLEPRDSVKIEDPTRAKQILKLMEELERHDDVESISSDFDIQDDIIEKTQNDKIF